MENPVRKPGGAVDSSNLASNITKSAPVHISLCRCHKPHHGHDPTTAVAHQVEALCLNEAASSDSVSSIPQPSTPSNTASTPPNTQPVHASDTTRKISSANTAGDIRQNQRKDQVGEEIKDLKEELCSYCFFSSFFPTLKYDEYREKTETLPLLASAKFKLTSPSSLHPGTREPWPTGPNEKVYYSPFASLLNEIVEHFNEITNPSNSKDIRFIVYDKQMAPVTPISLKPDLLLVEENFAHLERLQWKHPIIPIEVKNDFWDSLKQIGTYAREMLTARPGRQVCWALSFRHLESAFQVILLTPDRVHYTQPTKITSVVGYREMVKVIVALLSQPDLLTIGEDKSRDTSTKLLPEGYKLGILGMEFDRKSLVGRKTRIMSVTVVGKDGKGVESAVSAYGDSPAGMRKSSRTRNPPLSLNRQVLTTRAPEGSPSRATPPSSSSRQSRARSMAKSPEKQASTPSSPAAIPPSSFQRFSAKLNNSAEKQASVTPPLPNTPPPPYQRPRTRSATGLPSKNEDHFQPTSQDTTADIEADYTLRELHENPNETIAFAKGVTGLEIGEHLIVKESWPLLARQDIEWEALTSCSNQFGVPEVVYKVTGRHPMPVKCTQEPRVPQHIALREKGTRLHDAASPRMLLTALLHAIIGHWNFFQEGWLHRDVSIGNVLMLSTPVKKSPPTGLKGFENLSDCHGMLIDGDAMIHSTSDRKLGDHRSCTLPFLSQRLVKAWRLKNETFDQYFDDLDSFAWVLLWALLEIAESRNEATEFDRMMMENLNGNDLQSLMAGKSCIAQQLKGLSADIAKGLPKEDSTSLLDPFIILLDQWFDLTMTKRPDGNAGTLPSNEDSTEFYNTFITLAMNIIPDLPEKWDFEN